MNFQRNQSLLMKKIPLHYQRKLNYSSNGSFNTTFLTGVYKNKIRTLLKNNKFLALSLQNDRSKKEELLEENKANANIIMFSRLKLASLSDNLKQVVTVLDETLGLLEMHSSVSSTKFTPKHTVTREEFKEQVQNVWMDSIPEEPESPQRLSNMTDLNKSKKKKHSRTCQKQNDVSSGFQVEMRNKKQESSKKPTNSKKTLQPTTKFEKIAIQISDEIDMDPIHYVGNDEYCFTKSSPARKCPPQNRKIANRNKNITSKVNKIKAETKPATDKKCRKVTKKSVSKEVTFLSEGKNISVCTSSSKNNPSQSDLHNDFQIFADNQLPENNNKKKTFDEIDVLRNNSNKNSNFRSGSEKENVSPYKMQKLPTRKFKSLNTIKLEPTVTARSHSRNSAMQSLSSKINIENSIGQKKVDLIREGRSSESCDTSRSYLIDLSLHQQEMVRNLAENTFIVTADVHRNPEPLPTEISKQECRLLKEPIVLVKDIFKHGKSFCKSISIPACDELNEIPLELQLLKHCSSLKMIPEESNHSQDQVKEEVPKIKSENYEPSLTIEENTKQTSHEEKRFVRKRSSSVNYTEPLTIEENIKQTSHEEKRYMRKRSSSVNYREPPANIKLRR
ncbi:uncharacterized protein PF3D7_1120000 isoform X2 [Parasteatoda tepidariorum]|nr:uncharacterized protein LOC107443092 isoform X2 [Parasteatoda tepidariorum]XP_042902333.1 uncharacterized protein LOC107443092 isoform X2 [Parasteatoda tepidariorum]